MTQKPTPLPVWMPQIWRSRRRGRTDALTVDLPRRDRPEAATLPITPIVILNSGFGFSLEFDGCRIVDSTFLREYLRSPYLLSGGATRGNRLIGEEVSTLYTSEADAEQRFDVMIARPAVLHRFINRLGWDVVEVPLGTGSPPL